MSAKSHAYNEAMRQAKLMAKRFITSQDALSAALLQIQDKDERQAMFDMLKPVLSFNAEYPDHVKDTIHA